MIIQTVSSGIIDLFMVLRKNKIRHLPVEAIIRDVVRKRRSFKMTQNTFDKIWRRLPVALEY